MPRKSKSPPKASSPAPPLEQISFSSSSSSAAQPSLDDISLDHIQTSEPETTARHSSEMKEGPQRKNRRVAVDENGEPKWTPPQEAILTKLAKEKEKQEQEKQPSATSWTWKQIALEVPGHSADQCREHWKKVLNPELATERWTPEEDVALQAAYKQHGGLWSIIASHLEGRNGKQVRERWINHLNPNIKRTAWTMEEDEALIRARLVLKKPWSKMDELLATEEIVGRSANALKNRFNSFIKKKIGNTKDFNDALTCLRGGQDLTAPTPPPNAAGVATAKEPVRKPSPKSPKEVSSSSLLSAPTEMKRASSPIFWNALFKDGETLFE